MTSPTLIIITGAPATGKSTVSQRLGDELGLPLFTKDGFKEDLANILSRPLNLSVAQWSNKLGAASYEMLYHVITAMLTVGQSLIVEANFHPAIANAVLRRIHSEQLHFIIQVNCRADTEVIMERFRVRIEAGNRHPIHRYETFYRSGLVEALQAGTYDPLDIPGERLMLDTTHPDPADIDRIVARVRTLMTR
jgi:predicted kinase